MPRNSPYTIILTLDERIYLERISRRYTLPYYQVIRAQMILMAAHGFANDLIADRLNTRREIVSRWRKRFYVHRIKGLEEQPRCGRPKQARTPSSSV